jgi:hypothetical protein
VNAPSAPLLVVRAVMTLPVSVTATLAMEVPASSATRPRILPLLVGLTGPPPSHALIAAPNMNATIAFACFIDTPIVETTRA